MTAEPTHGMYVYHLRTEAHLPWENKSSVVYAGKITVTSPEGAHVLHATDQHVHRPLQPGMGAPEIGHYWVVDARTDNEWIEAPEGFENDYCRMPVNQIMRPAVEG